MPLIDGKKASSPEEHAADGSALRAASIDVENDPKGWALLAERLDAIPELLSSYLSDVFPHCSLKAGSVLSIGTGSSRAHADYLGFLCRTHLASVYPQAVDPLEYLEDHESKIQNPPNMVVFSQGLSPNVEAGLRRAFSSNSFLFTSATSHSLVKNVPKQNLLNEAVSSGIKTITYPGANEFEILPRFIGPFMGYVAVYRFMYESLLNETSHPLNSLNMRDFFSSASRASEALTNSCFVNEPHAFHLVATSPFHHLNHNLKEKIRECLLPSGTIESSSITEYEHGRFQQNCNLQSPGLEIILTTQERAPVADRMVLRRSQQAQAHEIPSVLIESPYNREISVLWFEMVFNYWLQKEVQHRGVNLREWPGKTAESQGITNYHETGIV